MIQQSDIPLVSLNSMNQVHYEEIELLNTLLTQLDTKADFETLSESMEKLLAHMQEHFAGEEKLMQEVQYPSFRMQEWRNRKDVEALREYLEEDVVPWLDQHIKAMDTPMADFVSQFEKYKGY